MAAPRGTHGERALSEPPPSPYDAGGQHTGGVVLSERLVGVTVMPEFFQNEGVGGVLDRLMRDGGVSAIGTSPYVMVPADERTGGREPPIDAGAGSVRLLDRPLWGKRELFVATAPAFVPDLALYEGLRYQPAVPDELTEQHGRIVADVIAGAKARGLEVHLQVQAAIPPGYRVQFGGPIADDRPRLPDGSLSEIRVDKNGSLASPHIKDYGCAMIRDLVRAYPEIDAIRVDWPEYPPYSFDSLFYDFCDHARVAASRLGFDFEAMRADAGALRATLRGALSDRMLMPWLEPDAGRQRLLALLMDHPGILDLLRFKALLVEELLEAYRTTLSEAGGAGKKLVAHAFPPPWSLISGMDFARAGRHADAIGAKLYTMHWPMMLRGYGEAIALGNPDLRDDLLVRALVRALDIADDAGLPRVKDYAYPEPEQAHPVGRAAQARKIREAQARAGSCPVHAMAHAYGPLEDVRNRFEVAYAAGDRRIWINRYGYMSDDKIRALGEVTRA